MVRRLCIVLHLCIILTRPSALRSLLLFCVIGAVFDVVRFVLRCLLPVDRNLPLPVLRPMAATSLLACTLCLAIADVLLCSRVRSLFECCFRSRGLRRVLFCRFLCASDPADCDQHPCSAPCCSVSPIVRLRSSRARSARWTRRSTCSSETSRSSRRVS